MKKLLIILLLIAGCDSFEWICTTNYQFQTNIVPDSPNTDPEIEQPPDTVRFFENIIYGSILECEEACPDDPFEVTTTASPDGTGEYFSMYCKNTN